MESRVWSLLKAENQLQEISIFGYSTKGIPGLEIHGIPLSNGKLVKEKIHFLTRICKLKTPLKRFVLCVEGIENISKFKTSKGRVSLNDLELPLLILYWKLAGFIPISNLEDCVVKGQINVTGKIYPSSIEKEDFEYLKQKSMKDLKALQSKNEEIPTIPIDLLFENIPKIRMVLPVR